MSNGFYIVKLPSGEYINLAFVQRVEVETGSKHIAVIHWHGGEKKHLPRNRSSSGSYGNEQAY